MPRLPIVGGDQGLWGGELNTWLTADHNADGSHAAWVNVKNPAYGAKGDGTTDDTSAVQAALNAVSPTVGGEVFFPPGNYLCASGGLVPQNNTSLRGIGRVSSYGSQVTLGSSATLPLFAISGVTGLQFDGLDLVAQSNFGGTAIGGDGGGCNWLLVTDCWFAGFYRGISIDSATATFQIWVFNNYFNAVRNVAGAAGIAMRGIQSPTIVQNFIQGNGTSDTLNAGIYTPAGGGACQYAVLVNNNMGQIGQGIYISDTGISDATIQANQVTGCGRTGMYLHNLTGCIISGNTVTDVSLSSSGGYNGYEITSSHGTSVIAGNIYENEFSAAHVDRAFYLNVSVPIVFKGNPVHAGDTVNGPLHIETGATPFTTPAAITVGASPYTYTNADGADETVWVVGGTVSSVVLARNSTNVTLPNSGPVLLAPGDTVTVTYSAAPAMTKVIS